jgi:hypothetical protein
MAGRYRKGFLRPEEWIEKRRLFLANQDRGDLLSHLRLLLPEIET